MNATRAVLKHASTYDTIRYVTHTQPIPDSKQPKEEGRPTDRTQLCEIVVGYTRTAITAKMWRHSSPAMQQSNYPSVNLTKTQEKPGLGNAYVRMCVCIDVCMYVCLCVCSFICLFMLLLCSAYVFMSLFIYVFMYLGVHPFLHLFTDVSICTCVHFFIYLSIYQSIYRTIQLLIHLLLNVFR